MHHLPTRRAQAGFSLTELMITVAIIAVLGAIAIPSYRNYILRGHRTDALRSLTFTRQSLERCYSQNFSYLGCTANVGGVATAVCPGPTASTNGYYTVTCVVAAATYTATATAVGTQTQDTNCTSFTVLQNGQQTALNSGGVLNTVTCWGSN